MEANAGVYPQPQRQINGIEETSVTHSRRIDKILGLKADAHTAAGRQTGRGVKARINRWRDNGIEGHAVFSFQRHHHGSTQRNITRFTVIASAAHGHKVDLDAVGSVDGEPRFAVPGH